MGVVATDSCNKAIALSLSVLLHFFLAACDDTTLPYIPTDYFLLQCGPPSTSSSMAHDGRKWIADSNTNFLPTNFLPTNSLTKSQISNASLEYKTSSVPQIPYMTARIIFSEFTYSFPSLSPGPKFLRLYFYPATYIYADNQTLNQTEPFFSVKANQNTLLSNFSAFLTVTSINPSSDTLVKEYIIHINDTLRELYITFLPNSDSYAFINGIEVVSIPNDLYFQGNDFPLGTGIVENPYYLKNDTALETLYRLNVGGLFVPATGDTGMYRAWNPDDDYVFAGSSRASRNFEVHYWSSDSAYAAPELVYTSARFTNENFRRLYNMTWAFPVDSDFYYLLRFHFCDFFLEPAEGGFSILINNQTVEYDADVISMAIDQETAVTRDFVVYVGESNGKKGKQDLSLTMKPVFGTALLNGLEIFKISRSNGSLNSPNPDFASFTSTFLPPKKIKRMLVIIIATTAGTVALVMIFTGIMILKRRETMNDSATPVDDHEFPLMVDSICRHFSFDEMKRATSNFDDNSVIGVGGFGSVYKGCIDNNLTEVAIKRLNPSSNQGIREFQTEIEMLSKLRHLHLVSLIGYCHEKGEMILVYDYMSRGTLRDHLYNTKNPHLRWKQRLQICLGVARGLHYLHTGSGHTIIHRDIKSTNILLDGNWVAKVSDFGLSKIGPISGSKYHISTMVKGSFGYLDPEYFMTQRLTEKSDVYSFGVVLVEALCACPAITQNFSGEHVNLAEWARVCEEDGTLDKITDPTLEGEIASDSLTKYIEITFKCLRRKRADRPAMTDVVWNLEFALQLQEDAEKLMSVKINEDEYEASPSLLRVQHGAGEPSSSSSGFTNLSLKSHDLSS